MKTNIILMALFISSFAIAQTEVRDLENFTKLNVDGRAEIHLIKSHESSIKIEMNKKYGVKNYISEVRNDELFLYYKKPYKNENHPKVVIYLYHTGITNMDLDGMIKLLSDDILNQSDLTIKGDGFIMGEIKVSVKNLQIDLDGFSKMIVSGKADSVVFSIDGMGKISATRLITKNVQMKNDGLTRIMLN